MYQIDDHGAGAGAIAPARVSPIPPRPSPEVRVLVLLPDTPHALALVRWAERLARASNGTFCCAHLTASGTSRSPRSSLDLRAAFRLADELGGRNVELHADVLFDELFRFATQHHITHVVVGKPRCVPLAAFLASTLPREFTEGDDGPRIVVVAEAARDPR